MEAKLLNRLKFPVAFVVLIWIIHLLKVGLQLPLGLYGVLPRTWVGLKGVLFSPLIHSTFLHLFSNSIPFLILSSIIFLFYNRVAILSFVLIYLLTGLMVWMFAFSNSYHIGASGVVYGMAAFVFWTGIFRRNAKSIVLALVVLFLYNGYFLGIVPNAERPNISWESHLYGALVGIFVAFLMKNAIEEDENEEESDYQLESAPPRDYYPRDLFDKTKWERYEERKQSENNDSFS